MSNTASGSTVSNDVISNSMTRIATTASKQKKAVAVGIVILLATTLAGSLYLNKRNAFRAQAAEALFSARQIMATEMKAYAESLKPAEKKKGDAKKEVALPDITFAKFDVDSVFKSGVGAMEKVADEFSSTQAGFDAKMELGALYFDHANGAGSYEKAAAWFDRAVDAAPKNEQSIAALYNLGYAQEALGRCADSVKTFDRGLNSGSGPLASELLRGKARCQESLGDKAAAKGTYEQMIKTLPNSEASRFAEMKKAAL